MKEIKTSGGWKRIGDVPKPCLHPKHNPPAHIVLKPGVYEHVCPGCGKRTVVNVPHVVAHVMNGKISPFKSASDAQASARAAMINIINGWSSNPIQMAKEWLDRDEARSKG